jgi:cytochrome P450
VTSPSLRDTARLAAARVAHSDIAPPRDHRRDVKRPPGPQGAALIGRFLRGNGVLTFFESATTAHPRLAHMRLIGEHMYLLNAPDVITEVMLTHGRDTMKGRGLQGTKAVLGNGLLTSEGEVHMRQRRLVQPAFHRDRLHTYAEQMIEATEQHLLTWRDGQVVDMTRDMSALTLAIVGRTLFGSDLRGDAGEVSEALEEVLGGLGRRLILGPSILRLPTPGRRRALLASARLDALVQRIIDEHRESGTTDDMLGMLIQAREDGVAMTDDQIRDEAMTLVLAGHETTAMALSWAWLLLSENPDQAAWLREELHDLLDDRPPTPDDYQRLSRTRAVVAESLRLYPPAWIMGRRLLTDLDIDGWTLPAGALCLASTYVQHRDARWWTDPQAFVPQRWLNAEGHFDESAPGVPRGAWFPFGWGNRRCIGEAFAWMEATLVLATIARTWSPAAIAPAEVRPTPSVTLRPEPALMMRLTS